MIDKRQQSEEGSGVSLFTSRVGGCVLLADVGIIEMVGIAEREHRWRGCDEAAVSHNGGKTVTAIFPRHRFDGRVIVENAQGIPAAAIPRLASIAILAQGATSGQFAWRGTHMSGVNTRRWRKST